ncbi:MAG: AMP-binding protein [Bacteroidota bacterium]
MEVFDFDFYRWEKERANEPFLRQPFGDTWEEWTWGEVGHMARKLATGLKSLGLPPGSHIGLVSKNCREWFVADIAMMMAGYVSVPFFPTLTGKQIAEVLELGDVKALFVGKLEVWDDMKTGVPEDMPVIRFPHYSGNSEVKRGLDWNEFLDKHEPLEEVAKPNLDDTWTIIFTSGTTGTPKGVMLSYKNLMGTKIPIESSNPLKFDKGGNNRFFSYLPLNHIAERIVVEQASLMYGGTVSFSESLDTFAKNLSETKPTFFLGVPRIYTKFQQGILAKMPQEKLSKMLKIPILNNIVKKKIRAGLGLNDARVWVSGAAPLPEALKVWFSKIGVYISNGYGMTENCAVCSLLDPHVSKPGAVGRPQPGVEVKIDPDTGEIMMRAPFVMEGYYKDPAKTAEVKDEEGWLRTGDQGRLDEDGDLHITGRVKDTFKTTKGEFIVPGPIEWEFGVNQDIEQICIVGLGCPQPMALVNLSEGAATKAKDEIVSSLESTRSTVNSSIPNYQRVSKIIVIDEPWSVENGMLTPTLKVKRNVMNERFRDAMQDWQNASDSILFDKK